MGNLTEEQANDLANNFLVLAEETGKFRINKKNKLTPLENQKLADWQWQIINFGEDFIALSVTLVMEDVQNSLAKIDQITVQIKGTIQTLKDIQKGIGIVAATVSLGTSILSKQPLAIADSIAGLIDLFEN
jgi:hypothetical protein